MYYQWVTAGDIHVLPLGHMQALRSTGTGLQTGKQASWKRNTAACGVEIPQHTVICIATYVTIATASKGYSFKWTNGEMALGLSRCNRAEWSFPVMAIC